MGVWKYILIILIIFIIFGAGKLPKVMEELGRGVRLFKKGLKGDDKAQTKTKAKAKTKTTPTPTPRKKVKPLAKKSKRPAKKK